MMKDRDKSDSDKNNDGKGKDSIMLNLKEENAQKKFAFYAGTNSKSPFSHFIAAMMNQSAPGRLVRSFRAVQCVRRDETTAGFTETTTTTGR